MKTQVEAVLESNEQTPPEYRVVCEGLLLEYEEDKWVCVNDFHKHTERVKGDTYATWTIHCSRTMIDGDEVVIHPYIVWTLIARPEGWSFGQGSYFDDEIKSFDEYKMRTR